MKKILFLLLVISLNSCIGLKKLTYVQETEDTNLILDENGYMITKKPNFLLEVDDVIQVSIQALNPVLLKDFNQRYNINNKSNNIDGLIGKRIDERGNIEVPGLGVFKASGISTLELQSKIQNSFKKLYNNSKDNIYVKVELSGVRFSILGEIRRPGKYQTRRNNVDIFEAIAMSGDLVTTSDRKKVLILRNFPEGEKIIELDLTDKGIINSPNYYLKSNDKIIINPLSQKIYGFAGNGIQTFTTILSIITSSIAMYFTILRLK